MREVSSRRMKPVSYVIPLPRIRVVPFRRERASVRKLARTQVFVHALFWDDGNVTTEPAGLRERKKQATRQALREAALRLALERGPDNVRVDDIAEVAGVSPRTYNNYFSSREQAIIAAVTAERESRVAAAVAARRGGIGLADAVVDAIVEQYTDPGERRPRRTAADHYAPRAARRVCRRRRRDRASPHRCDRGPARRHRDYTAHVLAASVAAAVHVALERWVRPAGPSPAAHGLVVPSGSLSELLRSHSRRYDPRWTTPRNHNNKHLKKCHGFETDFDAITVRQPEKSQINHNQPQRSRDTVRGKCSRTAVSRRRRGRAGGLLISAA